MNPCGTPAAYARHYRHNEKPCKQCRDAFNAYRQNWRKGIRGEPHARGARNVIVDVLSTYTEWMSFSVLVGRVQLHRPDLTEVNIRRSVDRLRDEGRLQVRERLGSQEYFTDEWSAYAS